MRPLVDFTIRELMEELVSRGMSDAHQVDIGKLPGEFVIAHPLRCRIEGNDSWRPLTDCRLHMELREGLATAMQVRRGPGRYEIDRDAEHALTRLYDGHTVDRITRL